MPRARQSQGRERADKTGKPTFSNLPGGGSLTATPEARPRGGPRSWYDPPALMRSSIIKDAKLAPEGLSKIRWVEQHAPVLNAIYAKYLSDGTLKGLSIAVCVPLEAKTAFLTLLLHRAGARVALAGTAPGYVQDDAEASIAEQGVTVFSVGDASAEEFETNLTHSVEDDPVLLVDDRAELTR